MMMMNSESETKHDENSEPETDWLRRIDISKAVNT